MYKFYILKPEYKFNSVWYNQANKLGGFMNKKRFDKVQNSTHLCNHILCCTLFLADNFLVPAGKFYHS